MLYRFHSKYKDIGKLNSSIYSYYHSANRILCRYHLNGKCQDENCNNLHLVKPSTKEILIDLISYAPSIAGVTRVTPSKQIPVLVQNFVVEFLKDKNELNEDDCLSLMMRLLKQKIKFSSIFDISRKWNPLDSLKETSAVHCLKLNSESENKDEKRFRKQYELSFKKLSHLPFSENKEISKSLNKEIEETISSKDVRYWLWESQSCIGKELENAVKQETANVSLWLRFAYSKLNDSSTVDYNSALKILAKAIQYNEKDSLLWTHYLNLYERSERQSNLNLVYEMALKKAPTYEIWWKVRYHFNIKQSIHNFLSVFEDAEDSSHTL